MTDIYGWIYSQVLHPNLSKVTGDIQYPFLGYGRTLRCVHATLGCVYPITQYTANLPFWIYILHKWQLSKLICYLVGFLFWRWFTVVVMGLVRMSVSIARKHSGLNHSLKSEVEVCKCSRSNVTTRSDLTIIQCGNVDTFAHIWHSFYSVALLIITK